MPLRYSDCAVAEAGGDERNGAVRIGEAPAMPGRLLPLRGQDSSPRGDRDLGPYLGGRSKRSEGLGHVRKGKASSSGTRLIVRQLCSDTRFTSQSNRGQRGISLIRRINSLMI